jgi:hypothetical protein
MDISGVTITESEPLAEDQTQPQEREPINTVNTFWERLDEVLVNLEGTKDLSQVPARPFLNQPDRVYISSNDDQSEVVSSVDFNEQTFSEFNVTLTKPLLGVKSIQLVSATIPQGGLSFPDQECTFWYYKGTKNQMQAGTYFVASNLHFVRILPSYYKPELVYNYTATGYSEWVSSTTYANGAIVTYNGDQYISIQAGNLNKNPATQAAWWTYQSSVQLNALTTFAWNRSFTDYNDLSTVLALATVADPWYNYSTNQIKAWSATTTYYYGQFVTYGGYTYFSLQSNNLNNIPVINNHVYWEMLEPTTSLPTMIPNDIQLTYDSTVGKIKMVVPEGTTSFYIAAGYNDPNVQEQAFLLNDLTTQSDFLTAMPAKYGQPFTLGRTLNLRLGFTWDGNSRSIDLNNTVTNSLLCLVNRFRPSPLSRNFIRDVYGGIDSIIAYTGDAPPNMVLSNRILIYADFVGPSSTGSGNNESLLCSVANAGTLGVLNYMATFYNPLTKVAPEIYTIGIRVRTDTLEPYRLPNSSIVGIELAIQYF